MADQTGIATLITVTVRIEGNELMFTYDGQDPKGDVNVYEAGTITYVLNDQTGKGLKFIGAGFVTPFDGVIEAATVSSDGKFIQLVDFDRNDAGTKMQFVLSNSQNSLLVLSKDPQIINHPKV